MNAFGDFSAYCTILTKCSVMGHKWLWIEHLRCFITGHRLLWTLHWFDFCIILSDLAQFNSKMNSFDTSHSQISLVNLVSKCSQASHVTPHEHLVEMVQYLDPADALRLTSPTRMTANELNHLAEVLDILDPFFTEQGYCFSAVEVLCLLCAWFHSSGDQYELALKYNRSQSLVLQVVNKLAAYLDVDDTWGHLLDFNHEYLLYHDNLSHYAKALQDVRVPVILIWGFIDCTLQHMCKPSIFQQQAYNGHKKYHALKFQALSLLNGLIGHLFGPEEGCWNDNFLVANSSIFDKCWQYAICVGTDKNTPINGQYYHVFGDPAYGVSPVLISPFSQPTEVEIEWKCTMMSSLHISVEHAFGIVVNTWPLLNVFWKYCMYALPISNYYQVAVLLSNTINCFHPNQMVQCYDCPPPTIDEYFHH